MGVISCERSTGMDRNRNAEKSGDQESLTNSPRHHRVKIRCMRNWESTITLLAFSGSTQDFLCPVKDCIAIATERHHVLNERHKGGPV